MTTHRVLIVSASIGAGHDGPAIELARRLHEHGHRAQVIDLDEIAPFGRALRAVFRQILARRPDLWGKLVDEYESTGQLPIPVRTLVAAAGRKVAHIAADREVDLAVSTFPLAGRVIGHARSHLDRPLPLATYLTDPAVHRLWIDPVTDLYLATWTFTHTTVGRLTDTPIALVAPAVRPAFTTPPILPSPPSPDHRSIALVGSGSWGVGDVLGSVTDLLAGNRFRPVVACGRNNELYRAIRSLPGAHALGWIHDMPAAMRASAVLVLNSGGLTLAEAATLGVPVIHHRPLPGQGNLNAQACATGAGIAMTADADQLDRALRHLKTMSHTLGTADPLDAILSLVRADDGLPAAA